jgi:hypothetical protein
MWTPDESIMAVVKPYCIDNRGVEQLLAALCPNCRAGQL